MALKEFIDSLSVDKQYTIAIKLAKLILPIWEQYADKHELVYRDTVVGLTHSVDRKLLENSIEAIEEYTNSKALFKRRNKLDTFYEQFADPVVSLKDNDWKVPYEVETAFFSIYNLIRNAIGKTPTVFDESSIYVSINQAADALLTAKRFSVDEINEILTEISSAP